MLRKAVGLVRRGIPNPGTDLGSLAEQRGYRLVYTVETDTGPFVCGLAVAQHVREHNAVALVLPDIGHAAGIQHVVSHLGMDLVIPGDGCMSPWQV